MVKAMPVGLYVHVCTSVLCSSAFTLNPDARRHVLQADACSKRHLCASHEDVTGREHPISFRCALVASSNGRFEHGLDLHVCKMLSSFVRIWMVTARKLGKWNVIWAGAVPITYQEAYACSLVAYTMHRTCTY